MEEAEKAARRGLDINKKDGWAQHAVSVIRKPLNLMHLTIKCK